MLRVYSCIADQHNPWLIVLAAVICAAASMLGLVIVQRAAALRGRQRHLWLGLAAAATGLGIWSTHFVAMLAYQSQLHVSYDIPRTLLSILAAVVLSGGGWWLELRTPRRSWSPLPALLLVSGIGTMHYLGMQALQLSGMVLWDFGYIVASLVIGFTFTLLALYARRRLRRFAAPGAALLYVLAICGLHFTAMTAVSIIPGPETATAARGIEPGLLALFVGGAAISLLLVGAMAVWLEHQLAQRRLMEQQQVEDFADAAIEGLAVVEMGRIVDANTAFRRLAGWATPSPLSDSLPGLPDLCSITQLMDAVSPREFTLRNSAGDLIAVEVSARPIVWRGTPHIVLAVTDIRDRKSAEAQIRHLAFHDPLTGIANRTLFLSSLIDAVARRADDQEIAVFCLDLDRFKLVNDVYGHGTGDELLRHVASQIRECAGDSPLAARFGGDEFAIFLESPDAAAEATSLASRLLARLTQPTSLRNQDVRISASIGIALIPGEAIDAETALRHADLALYRAKAEGRGTYRFFEPAMDAIAQSRAQLEADLRLAIPRGDLFIVYQPLVGVESGLIEGLEALVRWQHPTRGLILPDNFIPMAEDSGLIIELGEWVMTQACIDAASWDPPLRLSVNVSPVQFAYADVAAMIERILDLSGLPPAQLEIEITEGVLIRDTARALTQLEAIRALGVKIVMDDFGTGYSCLSYFRQFPFDKIKIDRSFVHDMLEDTHARSIVEAVISLGRGLGLQVVAEGVETEAQLTMLQQQGCGQVQGYFLSRPGPIAQFVGPALREEGSRRGSRSRAA